MKNTLFVILTALSIISSQAKAQAEEEPMPRFLIKARVVPVVTSLLTSLLAERLDHAFVFDAEYVVSPHFSMGMSVGHSRTSTVFDTSLGGVVVNDFRQEWILGLIGTYYFSPIDQGKSIFLRPHLYYMIVDNNPASNPNPTERIDTNMAVKGSGSRAGLEAGYVFRQGRMWLEGSAGFSAYLSNPYAHYGSKNRAGIPGWARNMVFGLGDVYPTVNFAVGVGF